jgi:hypothetical protein
MAIGFKDLHLAEYKLEELTAGRIVNETDVLSLRTMRMDHMIKALMGLGLPLAVVLEERCDLEDKKERLEIAVRWI